MGNREKERERKKQEDKFKHLNQQSQFIIAFQLKVNAVQNTKRAELEEDISLSEQFVLFLFAVYRSRHKSRKAI